MNASNEVPTETSTETSLTKDVISLVRYYLWRTTSRVRPYLKNRRTLIFLAVGVLGAGAALNWGWLVAIGVAPMLLALAPCAAMCALGLCMKGGGKSCSSDDENAKGSLERDKLLKSRDDT
jgi:hypothetical protein